MFSTRFRSSTHTPPGRHISRRLQLEQVTSNLRGVWIVAVMVFFLTKASAGMRFPLGLRLGGALGGHLARALGEEVAHALEFFTLVEKAARAERLGELAVWKAGEIRQQVEVGLGYLRLNGAQDVEAAACGERDIEQHHVGLDGEDVADRAGGVGCVSHHLRVGHALKHHREPAADRSRVFYEEHLHASQCGCPGAAATSAAAENALGRRAAPAEADSYKGPGILRRGPPRGARVTSKDPPMNPMRSRMPFKPSEPALARSPGAMPQPSSSTATSRPPFSAASTTHACLAPEWRAIFVSDSWIAR